MKRNPVVAGQFYPGHAEELDSVVRKCIAEAGPRGDKRTILAMVPHAGYIYSGKVAGKTLGEANLAETVILLGPNHTGLGLPMAVWDKGEWDMPGGGLKIHEELADVLVRNVAWLESDTDAHLREHSLEVICPFLRAVNPNMRIVPVAISDSSLSRLLAAGRELAENLKSVGEDVSIVVSSDMSHFISHERASELDHEALEPVMKLDPEGLYSTVREKSISMCGVLPMTMGLAAARALGATECRVTAYATSAEASGDYANVVGYAGVIVS